MTHIAPGGAAPHHIVLDTDIASDVDDAMALAVILGSDTLHLDAVLTVYGDTLLRARVASRYANLAERQIRIIPGHGETLSGKAVWWPGHEGTLHDNLENENVDESNAVAALSNLLDTSSEPLHVVAIGPLTNIAWLIKEHPQQAAKIAHLWVMGGAFDRERTEHNFRSDSVAAREVFASTIPTTVVGLEVTEQLQVTEHQIAHLGETGPLSVALLADIAQWRSLWGKTWNVPHDPLTVLALTNPELFTFSSHGTVSIRVTDGDDDGLSTFTAGAGNTRLITGMQTDSVTALMFDRINLASSAGRPRVG